MAIIEVRHVSKEYRLGQLTTLRNSVTRGLARIAGRPLSPRPRFFALNDVDFSVEPGEVLGIIGTNGAGKSTLLKLLARITVPSAGSVSVRGKTAPLIEVGAGLISDLTGRENIYLNGIILGMSYRQIRRKVDEIIAFAELEEFIDTPIKRYSSGMQVRLGFSIATAVESEVLIVDEVLAVGDLAFQRKCFDRIEEMIKKQGRTILLVSHNTRQVERLCTRVLLLDHGRILADGGPAEICDLFYERSDEKIRLAAEVGSTARFAHAQTSPALDVEDIALVDETGTVATRVRYEQSLAVRVRFTVHHELRSPVFTVGVHSTDFLYLTTHSSSNDLRLAHLAPGAYEIACEVARNPLLPGIYGLRFGINEGPGLATLFYGENLLHFQVVKSGAAHFASPSGQGFFALDARWNVPRPARDAESELAARYLANSSR